MDSYVHSLFAADAFFHASDFVSRREFQLFVGPLLEAQPGMRAIEWTPRVRHSKREKYRSSARADGYDFEIKPFLGAPPATTREADDDSYPVFYVEPYSPNAIALGIDVGTDPIRREALERARDTGAPAATAPVRLVQDSNQAWSTIVFVPHYAEATPPDDLEARRETLVGLLLGAFRLPDLLAEATSDFDPEAVEVSLFHEGQWLAAIGPNGESTESSDTASESPFEKTEDLEMGGRRWQVRCTPTSSFMATQRSIRPLLVMLSGLAATLLVAGSLFAATRAAEISEALAQSEERYRTLVEHAPEAILVLSVDQDRFIDFNDNACRMLKRSRAELKTASLTDVSAKTQPDGKSTTDAARSYLQKAVDGEAPVFLWTHLDGEGNEIPCEVCLVRLPSKEHIIVRGSITDITERVRTQARQKLMMRELDHRVKNNLATVLSLTEQSASDAQSVEELRRTLAARIHAMAETHRLLAQQQWSGVEIGELIRITLSPYQSTDERIRTNGPPLTLEPNVCSALSMILHELATNAAKYGALTAAQGRVELVWRTDDEGVSIDWTESGGPAVRTPDRSGYGNQLITGLVAHELGGHVDIAYRSEGLRCRIRIPLKPRQLDAGDGSPV